MLLWTALSTHKNVRVRKVHRVTLLYSSSIIAWMILRKSVSLSHTAASLGWTITVHVWEPYRILAICPWPLGEFIYFLRRSCCKRALCFWYPSTFLQVHKSVLDVTHLLPSNAPTLEAVEVNWYEENVRWLCNNQAWGTFGKDESFCIVSYCRNNGLIMM